MLTLLGTLIGSFVLIIGCINREDDTTKIETQNQIIEDITAKEGYTLIRNNKDNPSFVILDVRTPKEFANEHLENAINLDYYAKTFHDDLNKLDKNKTYLIYCRTGRRSGISLGIMKELSFREAYNMLGGIIKWKEEGLPTINYRPSGELVVVEFARQKAKQALPLQSLKKGNSYTIKLGRLPVCRTQTGIYPTRGLNLLSPYFEFPIHQDLK